MENIQSDLIAALAQLDRDIQWLLSLFAPKTTQQITSKQLEEILLTKSTIQALQSLPPSLSVIEKPFTDHRFFVANQPITSTGDHVDIGRNADVVMVMPTIDAQIEFDRNVESSTPIVLGGTVFTHPQRTRIIYYKAVAQNVTGSLNVWAYWW